jgi:hypothetical protein
MATKKKPIFTSYVNLVNLNTKKLEQKNCAYNLKPYSSFLNQIQNLWLLEVQFVFPLHMHIASIHKLTSNLIKESYILTPQRQSIHM